MYCVKFINNYFEKKKMHLLQHIVYKGTQKWHWNFSWLSNIFFTCMDQNSQKLFWSITQELLGLLKSMCYFWVSWKIYYTIYTIFPKKASHSNNEFENSPTAHSIIFTIHLPFKKKKMKEKSSEEKHQTSIKTNLLKPVPLELQHSWVVT